MSSESLVPTDVESRLALRDAEMGHPAMLLDGYVSNNGTSVLREYWQVLYKRRWVIFTCAVVIFTLGTIWTLRARPQYEAVTRIAMSRESSDVLGFKDMSGAGQYEDTWDYNVALDTQVKILQSETLALHVIDQLDLRHNAAFNTSLGKTPIRWLAWLHREPTKREQDEAMVAHFFKNLTVSKVRATRLIELRYLSPDPELSAQVVNALANAYLEQTFKYKLQSTEQVATWIQKQLDELQLKVESSQEKLVKYQKDHNILGIDDKQNIITAKLDELNRQLTAAEADCIQKKSVFDQLRQEPDLAPVVTGNELIQKLREQESELASTAAQLSTKFGPSYPKVVESQNQVKEVQRRVHAELDRIAGRLQNEYLAAKQREDMLRAALEAQKLEANQLNQSGIEYSLLKREFDSNRQLYEGLLTKAKEADVSAGLRANNINIIDVARPPAKPAKPNVPLNIALAMFLGLTCGVASAFVTEAIDSSIRTPMVAEAVAQVPVLGVIPSSSNSSANTLRYGRYSRRLSSRVADTGNQPLVPALMVGSHPKSPVAEAYRALRTSILLSSFNKPPRVLVFTSAQAKDGKTTTCVNTAMALVQSGAKVLLIDADMRKPSLNRTLVLSNEQGLSTVLSGTTLLSDAIRPVPGTTNLSVITAGPIPPYPAELLGSEDMKTALSGLRSQYDHIIIDTPPVLAVTDAVLLATQADSVILVVRAGKTSRYSLQATRGIFAQVGLRLRGLVLNAVDVNSPDYAYTYYSGYGRAYGDTELGDTAATAKRSV